MFFAAVVGLPRAERARVSLAPSQQEHRWETPTEQVNHSAASQEVLRRFQERHTAANASKSDCLSARDVYDPGWDGATDLVTGTSVSAACTAWVRDPKNGAASPLTSIEAECAQGSYWQQQCAATCCACQREPRPQRCSKVVGPSGVWTEEKEAERKEGMHEEFQKEVYQASEAEKLRKAEEEDRMCQAALDACNGQFNGVISYDYGSVGAGLSDRKFILSALTTLAASLCARVAVHGPALMLSPDLHNHGVRLPESYWWDVRHQLRFE
jgi:hypothetical protein